jgi:hypothetical protein
VTEDKLDHDHEEERGDDEKRLLLYLQIGCAIIFALLIVFMVVVDTLGRLYVDKDFHVSDVFLLAAIGALAGFAGITVLKLPSIGGKT